MMDDQMEYTITPEERELRRQERIAKRLERQHQRRMQRMRSIFGIGGVCLALAVVISLGVMAARAFTAQDADSPSSLTAAPPQFPEEDETPPVEDETPPAEAPFSIPLTESAVTIGDELSSSYAIVIDLTGQEILAQKDAFTVIHPASMTKILTVLVAAEHLTDEKSLDDTVTIDLEITDYCYTNDCSVAGFERDEVVPVRELFYGTILPSGADAALALARYIAGSHEAFVELMNAKVEELGLSETAHFTNCVGLYNKRNVCTVYDMAMILRAAMENELCREVLTTRIHEIAANELHPDGMILSNWFLRRIEDYVPDGMTVIGAKTGYVSAAGSCAASIAQTDEGAYYICVTADTTSSKQCVQDHVQLYTTYMGY